MHGVRHQLVEIAVTRRGHLRQAYACLDRPPAHGCLGDDAGVVAGVRHRGRGRQQVVQDDRCLPLPELEAASAAQLRVHRQRVDRLAALVQVLHDAEQLAVRRLVELLGA